MISGSRSSSSASAIISMRSSTRTFCVDGASGGMSLPHSPQAKPGAAGLPHTSQTAANVDGKILATKSATRWRPAPTRSTCMSAAAISSPESKRSAGSRDSAFSTTASRPTETSGLYTDGGATSQASTRRSVSSSVARGEQAAARRASRA